jgi:predicted ATPase
LAVELGWSFKDQLGDGIWLVDLAPLAGSNSIAAAVASTLSIRPLQGITQEEAIIDWLTGRELLVILDNCEHLLEPVRRFVAVVVAQCPTVRVVATSREPLGLVGERVFRVSVLDPESDGLALFIARATAADHSFDLRG